MQFVRFGKCILIPTQCNAILLWGVGGTILYKHFSLVGDNKRKYQKKYDIKILHTEKNVYNPPEE